MFLSTKEYGHDVGLSCCFRQWRAKSHCNKLHGYALAVKFIFGARQLDHNNWVIDFGGLKTLKAELQDLFDHTLLVAEDDPQLEHFLELQRVKIANVIVVPAVGCEMFATLAFDCGANWLTKNGYAPRVTLVSVEVKEHGANSAIALNEEVA
jgi:6-pyruvoyltetrahydropterin/6-carboxytetrahydropterin synthase